MPTDTNEIWLSAPAVAKRHGLDAKTFRKIAKTGVFDVREMPGFQARYSLSSVERYFASVTTRAMVD